MPLIIAPASTDMPLTIIQARTDKAPHNFDKNLFDFAPLATYFHNFDSFIILAIQLSHL